MLKLFWLDSHKIKVCPSYNSLFVTSFSCLNTLASASGSWGRSGRHVWTVGIGSRGGSTWSNRPTLPHYLLTGCLVLATTILASCQWSLLLLWPLFAACRERWGILKMQARPLGGQMVFWKLLHGQPQSGQHRHGQHQNCQPQQSTLTARVSQKKQKSEFWNVTYPSGFHRLDEPPEKISAL